MGVVQKSEIGPSAGPEKEAEESDASDKRRTGMHEGETGPAQGAPLGRFGVACAAQHFSLPGARPPQAPPLRTTVATKGEEGRGACGAWA